MNDESRAIHKNRHRNEDEVGQRLHGLWRLLKVSWIERERIEHGIKEFARLVLKNNDEKVARLYEDQFIHASRRFFSHHLHGGLSGKRNVFFGNHVLLRNNSLEVIIQPPIK